MYDLSPSHHLHLPLAVQFQNYMTLCAVLDGKSFVWNQPQGQNPLPARVICSDAYPTLGINYGACSYMTVRYCLILQAFPEPQQM